VDLKQSRENLKAKSWAFGKKHKMFMEEIIQYQMTAQKGFALLNAILLIILGILFIVLDYTIWHTFRKGTVFCLAIGLFNILYYFVCIGLYPKHRNLVIPVGNVFVFLMGKSLLAVNMVGGGDVSWTLLLCSLISTSFLIIIPAYYTVDVLLIIGFDLIEYAINSTDAVSFLYNLLDDVIIGIFCIGINAIFSRMKYAELERNVSLYSESAKDPLTQLFNRRYLESFFAGHASAQKKCAFLMLDLDNFKMANDVFGHKKGDEVLCKVAEILRTHFRGSDCIARLGGDEFAVFLPEVAQTEVVMERVEQVLNSFPIVIEGEKTVEVSVSIGVVIKEAGMAASYTQLNERADGAMYRAKKAGKAQAVIATAGMTKETFFKEKNHNEKTVYERYQHKQKA
jgi:diguanylate cyclase (GGDEF)-like protein